ncbi:hypothetical protein EHF33_01200 [Deinococcus psychrotolerans]|uniref:Uncharacterized protein n=1 Tax=Deinococcus psychrotolerans TaxID=2489213 RepID=A0A3G8Y9B1_9DEIO|nr:hypothetical protein [Deinococcus psychrotolerans]AZI41540.1 hypothetical protein EHF33_01200 [Deinococcus psychrotolerans]
MKKLLTLTLLVSSIAATAQAASLTDQLPAGALLTFETHNAGAALDRFTGLVGGVMKNVMGDQQSRSMMGSISGFEQVLKSSIGKEAVAGVFSVGGGAQAFEPQLLAVTRVDEFSSEFFRSMIEQKPGAKVGVYPFVRQGGMFVGQAKGLVYLSSDKSLLMSYLARLSGKVAPRLGDSVSYSVPTKAVGQQELSLFLNFSGIAKVARNQLAKIFLPRLLSPVVDAVDTLGTYSAGFSTNAQGLSAQSAHAANAYGKDQPLYRVLTHSTDFDVQNLIPASAETVVTSACAPESNAYAARWLNRIDLFDPVGFLTDSQLSSYLEESSRYLGDQCAQVTLAGGTAASFNAANTAQSLDYTVTYQKVSDMAAAQAAMPKYAASVNMAVAGVAKTLDKMMNKANLSGLQGMASSEMELGALAGAASSIKQVNAMLGSLKMVYAFKDGYLVTAFSQKALMAALAENAPKLASDPKFMAANLTTSGSAGWQYARAPQKVTNAQLMKLFTASAGQADMKDMEGVLKPVAAVTTDLINRYGGMSSQSSVSNNLIVTQSKVAYRWGK